MGDKQRAEQGHLCRTGASTAVGDHLTSWFAHAMRCSCGTSNSFAFLDSTAFWRGGLMYVVCVCVCVCVELQAFCIRRFASLDLTAFWRGGPMHCGR